MASDPQQHAPAQNNRTNNVGAALGLPPPNFSGVSFEAKWDLLRPWLHRLYLDERKSLQDIRQIIKEGYGFDAPPHSYKYHFQKWGWEKRLSSLEKWRICNTLHTRASIGKTMTDVLHLGRPVEPATLRRYLKDTMRQKTNAADLMLTSGTNERVLASSRLLQNETEQGNEWKRLTGSAAILGNSIFLNWRMPFLAMSSYRSKARLYPSPPAPEAASLAVVIKTPERSPLISQKNLSPILRTRNEIMNIDRAKMFVEGRHFDLVKSLSSEEQKIMSDWLYQYWYFAFKTAKHWGYGPLEWRAETLSHCCFKARTPKSLSVSPIIGSSYKSAQPRQALLSPPSLCRYTLHCSPEQLLMDDTVSADYTPLQDPHNENSWQPWPTAYAEDYQHRLQDSLASNDFSTIPTDSVPINTVQIAEAARGSGISFLKEAIGFSIMGRNQELLRGLLRRYDEESQPSDHEGFYPLHLAASFLDGSRACCLIFHEAILFFSPDARNSLGFTVFDNLLLKILTSHTSLQPSEIDPGLRGEKQLPGEEVDICGRWDADSECYIDLISKGVYRVPESWKHKFCHTSVQAVCECISHLDDALMEFQGSGVREQKCGLFTKLCTSCGLRVQLFPLHATVLTAINLVEYGMEGEDLFGIIAIALCLLACESPYDMLAAIPTSLYFSSGIELDLSENSDELRCSHEMMTASQLADSVPKEMINKWTPSQKKNWKVLCLILQRSCSNAVDSDDKNINPYHNDDEGHDDDYGMDLPSCSHSDRKSLLFGRRDLVTLWASVQVELLTYRRLRESDPWVSDNIDIDKILNSLEHGLQMSTGSLTDNSMIQKFCDCGRFVDWDYPMCCRAELACNSYFMNLDERQDLLCIIPPPSN